MFHPGQIVCIEGCTTTNGNDNSLLLLAEVIQVVPERERCWARPLAIAQQENFQLNLRHDLREASQLILPAALFRAALDTEVLSVIAELFQRDKAETWHEQPTNAENLSRQALHHFIRHLAIR